MYSARGRPLVVASPPPLARSISSQTGARASITSDAPRWIARAVYRPWDA